MSIISLEVLEVVEEGWPLEAVRGSTGFFHTVCHPWWTAGEHTDLRKQDVVLLEAVEELVEVRTAKVGDRAQSGKETASRELLKVPLADVLCGKEKNEWHTTLRAGVQIYQHSGTKVKLVEELGDEDVIFYQTLCVCVFHILDDVGEPLPLLLATCHPNEKHLN